MAVRSKRDGYEVYYRDPVTGKQRSRYFRTQQEAKKEDRRIKYLLEFDRETLIKEDAARTPVPKAPEPEPEPEQPKVSKDDYLFRNVHKSLVEWQNGKDPLYQRKGLLDRCGNIDVRTFSRQTYALIYKDAHQRGVQPQSVHRDIVRINCVLRHAVNIGLIDRMPERISLPEGESEEFIPPSEEELAALYTAAPSHVKRVIILGSLFGMRVGSCELLSLRWDDIDLQNWVINLRAAKKNRHESVRTLPIPQFLRKMFTDWHTEDSAKGISFVVSYKGKKVGKIQRSWAGTLLKAGITRRIRPYDLRHAFATNALRKGVDLGTLVKLMGHRNSQMILKYYQHISGEEKLAALENVAENAFHCMENVCMDKSGRQ